MHDVSICYHGLTPTRLPLNPQARLQNPGSQFKTTFDVVRATVR